MKTGLSIALVFAGSTGAYMVLGQSFGTFLVSTVGGASEATSWALMLVGFGGMGAIVRAKRRRMIPVSA